MGLTEVPAIAQEVILAAHIEVRAVVALEVLVRRQEAQAVGPPDPLAHHLAEVVVEIINFNDFLKSKILI